MDWKQPQINNSIEQIDYEQSLTQLSVVINYIKQLIALYPENLRESKMFDQWSLKDILSHFIGWNIVTINDINRTLQGQTKDNIWIDDSDIDIFNAQEVEKRRAQPWAEVYQEFIATVDTLMQTYSQIPLEMRNLSISPTEENFPISSSVVVDIKHFIYHIFEIETTLSRID